VPVLTPKLSSLWIGLVTPLPTGLARPLVGSLSNEVVVRDPAAAELMPHETLSFRDAVGLALQRVQDLEVATTWANAAWGGGTGIPRRVPDTDEPEDPRPEDPEWSGGTVLADEREVASAASPEAVWEVVCSLGGERGYHTARWLWALRGLLDKLVGGIGLRRGRRHPRELAVGDAVDFWRVEQLERPRWLLLVAEMRLPGQAWLEFLIEPRGSGSLLRQRARFHPRGLLGRLYWYGLMPFHQLIFPRMARRIAAAAVREQAGRPPRT
jgi:hypothetical protein